MSESFNPEKEEYKMLIEQRKMLVDSITTFTKAFHTSIFAILAAGFAAGGFFASIENWVGMVFVTFQIIFFGVFFIMLLLFCMNCDCDYIRAIDKHIQNKYDVKTLFYQGEMRYQHVNKMKSEFSFLTLAVGVFLFLCVLILSIYFIFVNIEVVKYYWYLSLIIVIELIVMIVSITKNFIYKIRGKSKYYDDVYRFLSPNETASKRVSEDEMVE